MQNGKSLSLQIAGAVALATLFGTSAFAESRHQQGTSRGSSGRVERSASRPSGSSNQTHQRSVTQTERRSVDRGSWNRNDTQRSTQREVTPRNDVQRSDTRNSDTRNSDTRNSNGNWRGNGNNGQRYDSRNNNQRYDSRNNNQRNGNQRNGNQRYESRNNGQRGPSNDRFRSVEGWHGGSRAPYRAHERVSSYGRVDRYERSRNGYRVWIGGGLFPIFIPFEHWRLHPLRVGINIRFGGYWDPLGYWSVYDYAPYDGYYNGGYNGGYYGNVYSSGYTSGSIRGVVESIDYRRGTLVLNDDISRQFVTVTMPRDRSMDDVREGDYVEFSGDWTRGGIFNAYRLDRLDENRDNQRY